MNSANDSTFPSQGRLCGVDFGTVRIGVAISDPEQKIASPLETYTRRSDQLDSQYFQELVHLESIAGFVVGLPVHQSGDASKKSNEANQFGHWLHSKTERPIVYFDERYTTSLAREIVGHSELSGKKKKAMLDKIAAQVILRAYLESPDKAIFNPASERVENNG